MSKHFYIPDRESWEMSMDKPGELAEPPPEGLQMSMYDSAARTKVDFVDPTPQQIWEGCSFLMKCWAVTCAVLLVLLGIAVFCFSPKHRRNVKEIFRKRRREANIAR